ncbi:hypothetical protein [Sinorhizobium meliloti]|uniref:hypothetical protein n=1 Tax=Rhizobium meliloti TaxID=382 RepID=UPI0018E74FB0|nr:hypothetical protein [Sinorhizobium meliloti]QQF06234.1 hypothetical protein JFX10_24810 [Sinorhizobium meliloti]
MKCKLFICVAAGLISVFTAANSAVAQQTFVETIPAVPELLGDCAELSSRQTHYERSARDLKRAQEALQACTDSGCSSDQIAQLSSRARIMRRINSLAERKLGVISSRYADYIGYLDLSSSPVLAFYLGERLRLHAEEESYYTELRSTFPTKLVTGYTRRVSCNNWCPEEYEWVDTKAVSKLSAPIFSAGSPRLYVDLETELVEANHPGGVLLYAIGGTVGEICGMAQAFGGAIFVLHKEIPRSDRLPVSLSAEIRIAITANLAEETNIELRHIAQPFIETFLSTEPHTMADIEKVEIYCSADNWNTSKKLFSAIGRLRGNIGSVVGDENWPTSEQLFAESKRSFTRADALEGFSTVSSGLGERSWTAAMGLSLFAQGQWIGEIEITRTFDDRQTPPGYRVGLISVRDDSGVLYRCESD